MRAVRRGQRRALLALEIVVQHQLAVVLGEHEVDAGALEVAGEQQARVGDDDRVGRRMRRNGVDMGRASRLRAVATWKRSVEFIGQTQKETTAIKVYIYRISKRLSLHIIGGNRAIPYFAREGGTGAPASNHICSLFTEATQYSLN